MVAICDFHFIGMLNCHTMISNQEKEVLKLQAATMTNLVADTNLMPVLHTQLAR